MNLFNYYGLFFFVALMLPNLIWAIRNKQPIIDNYEGSEQSKNLFLWENISRIGSVFFLIFNIPFTWFGFYFSFAETIYLVVNIVLIFAYLIIWLIMYNKNNIVKGFLLSIIPSLVFVFSGIMVGSLPLIFFSIIFMICHTKINLQFYNFEDKSPRKKKNMLLSVFCLILSVMVLSFNVFGGIVLYQAGQYNSLVKMTSKEMIDFNVKNSETKISVAIINNGELTYEIYGNNGKENEIYDYEIGSLSQTFLGLLYSKLIYEGKLNLYDHIDKFLKLNRSLYYPSLQRLLTHTSGYEASYCELKTLVNKFSHLTTNEYYGISSEKIFERLALTELEEKDYPFENSNFGISVLGYLLETLYQKDYSEIIESFISQNIGLENTKVADENTKLDASWKWKEKDGYRSAMAMISNIKDMGKYLQFYIIGSEKYIESAYREIKTVNATTQNNEKMNIRTDAMGKTWMVDKKNDIVWQNGTTPNCNSYMAFTKDKKYGVVLLGNFNSETKISLTNVGIKMMLEYKNQ